MKKIICIICLLLIVSTGGCAAWGTYYYQSGKTLEECSRNYLECNHTAFLSIFYPWCMKARGYKGYWLDELPAGVRTSQVEFSGVYVAGE